MFKGQEVKEDSGEIRAHMKEVPPPLDWRVQWETWTSPGDTAACQNDVNTGRKISPDQGHFPRWWLGGGAGKETKR